MKKILTFLIALSPLSTLSAADMRVHDNAFTYDRGNPVVRSAIELMIGIRSLGTFENFGYENSEVTFQSKKEAVYAQVTQSVAAIPDATRDTVGHRISGLLQGVTRRIASAYDPLFQRCTHALTALQELVVPYGVAGTHISLPGLPMGSALAVPGSEKLVTDCAQTASNLLANYQRAKALLVGARKVPEDQLIIFVTGAPQMVRNGKVIFANPEIQALYAAYADSSSDLDTILRLEYRAAPYLLGDSDSPITATFYESLDYRAGEICPVAVTREEVLDKPAILQALAQAANIQMTAQAAAAAAAEPPLPERMRMFTNADDVVLRNITQRMQHIINTLTSTGGTPAGYGRAEVIMDYGTEREENSSITREMREQVSALLAGQFARRGVNVGVWETQKTRIPVDMVPDLYQGFVANREFDKGRLAMVGELKGVYAVAGALVQWFNEMQFGFNDADTRKISTVLFVMAGHEDDIANDTHLQFLDSLWQMRSLYNSYQDWHNATEKKDFLDALKTSAYQNFMHVLDHAFNESGSALRCNVGARGRAFLVNMSMIDFLRDKHPEWEIRR